jgi:hypothetical protein
MHIKKSLAGNVNLALGRSRDIGDLRFRSDVAWAKPTSIIKINLQSTRSSFKILIFYYPIMQRDQVQEDVSNVEPESEKPVLSNDIVEEPHSIYTTKEKRIIILSASIAAFFSPLSANIYLPALNTLARNLNVSNTLITLTVCSYVFSS